jgi:uncharacterized protein involved in outer membrane biogenesis
MKKVLIGTIVGLVLIVVVAVLLVGFFLDSAIRKGVETVGPRVTKVDVKLASVSLSLLSGAGAMKGLVIGNPEGYKTPSAISVGSASLVVQPGSIFSDKIVIRSVKVEAPEITFETDLKNNNLNQILANVQASSGGGSTPAKPAEAPSSQDAKANKKLQVDEFVIAGGRVNVSVTALGVKPMTVALPEIRLHDLGQGPDGITAAELTKLVLQAIEKEAAQASSGAVADLGKDAAKMAKQLGEAGAAAATEKITKGLGGLIKK